MYKQILSFFVIVALSAAVVVFMPQAKLIVAFLVDAHGHVSNILGDVFSGGNAGNIARGLVALIAIPFLAGLIPSLIYFLVRKHWCPYFMEIVWMVWLLQAGALIVGTTLPTIAV